MPTKVQKNKSFNLIHKDVQLRKNVKVEKDWYVLFNVLVLSIIVSLSLLAFLFRLNIESEINRKKETIADKANSQLNTPSKDLLKAKVQVLNDKYAIYQDFMSQNFDVNVFYSDVSNLYPNIKVTRFNVQAGKDIVELGLQIDSKGYNEIPIFLNTLEASPKFKNAVIKDISFSAPEELNSNSNGTNAPQKTLIDFASKPDTFITQVTLYLSKADILPQNDIANGL